MTNFAYLRVSTDHQDAKNQKLGILDYCNNRGISALTFVEDTVSGKSSWRERAIGTILEKAVKGDVIVASEISRLGRSTLQVLDGSMQSTITATILGLAAQIEREFISARTKEALAKRKNDGMKLGRPKGEAGLLKLDAFCDEITGYLKKGINKRAIAKLIECSPSTLYKWLNRRQIRIK